MKLLRLAPENTKFGFMRFRRVSYPFSAVLSIVSVVLFLTVGMNYGIDFAGGTMIEVRADAGKPDLAQLRKATEAMNVGPVGVQSIGENGDVAIRFGLQSGGDAAQEGAVERVRHAIGDHYKVRQTAVVGPTVSGELVQSGTLGVVISILAVLCYLWFRFEWQFAVGAIIATMHDLLLTVGFFSITQLEFNTTSIAAILTIVGYSLNETVVVLDRIREMMRKYRKISTNELIDLSVNAVLPRTIMTATTVFLALLSLVLFGGEVIRSFSLAMMWGIFVATYSSIFICSPMLIYLGLRHETTAEPIAPKDQIGAVAVRRKRRLEMTVPDDRPSGFLPGVHPIDGYGAGGFQFGGMSHRGSILALPSGIHAWDVADPADLTLDAFARVIAEARETRGIDLLLIGTGARMLPLFDLRDALRASGVAADPMATDAAARTYSILLGEKRRVAAALLAIR